MGLCYSCFRGATETNPSTALIQDAESRRRRQLEAAEKRRRENESRGVRDVERLRRQQQRQLDIERRLDEASKQPNTQSNLKWQTNA